MPDDSVTYEGLSVRDKAKQVVKEMGETGQIVKVAWMMETEKALNAQIEDCAKLLDREAKGFQVLIDHAPTPIRAEDLKRVKHSIKVVANQIRALA